MDNLLWKLNSFLYKRAPRLLAVLQTFTFVEWLMISFCGFVVFYKFS